MATSHLARVGLMRRAATGQIYVISGNKVNAAGTGESVNLTIQQTLSFDEEHRVIVDTDIPNTSGNPTIKEYVETEATDGFLLKHMDQYIIVTEMS